MITFDGVNKEICINTEEKVTVEYIYSRWKDWVLKDLNAKFLPAFKTHIKNNEQYYELYNGWSISNPEMCLNLDIII